MTTKVLEKEVEKKAIQIKSETDHAVSSPEKVAKLDLTWPDQATFGELKTLGSNEVADIGAEFLPQWLADHVKVLAKQNNIPEGVAVILAITVLSAAIETRFFIQPQKSCQPFNLNILSLIATDTTNGKSVINGLIKPLTDVDQAEIERKISSIDDHEITANFWKKTAIALTRKAVKTEVEARTQERRWGEVYKIDAKFKEAQSIVSEAYRAMEMKPKFPHSIKRIIAEGMTEKSFPMDLASNYGKIAIISDDVNLLKVMASPAFLQASNSRTFKVEIDKKPLFYDNVSLTAGLLIPIQVLEDLRNQSKRDAEKRELMAKSLLYVSNGKLNSYDFLSKLFAPGIEQAAYVYALNYLLKIDTVFTKDENTGQYLSGLIKLSSKANDLWFEFTDWLESESESNKGGALTELRQWLENLPIMALRIAAILHIALLIQKNIDLAKSSNRDQRPDILSPTSPLSPFNSENWKNNSEISFETMQAAVGLCSKLITHAKAAYGLIDGESIDTKDISYAITWVFNNVKTGSNGVLYIKEYDLYRSTRFRKSKAIRKAKIIDKLADLNILSLQIKLRTRKPTAIRLVNPDFIERFYSYCYDDLADNNYGRLNRLAS